MFRMFQTYAIRELPKLFVCTVLPFMDGRLIYPHLLLPRRHWCCASAGALVVCWRPRRVLAPSVCSLKHHPSYLGDELMPLRTEILEGDAAPLWRWSPGRGDVK